MARERLPIPMRRLLAPATCASLLLLWPLAARGAERAGGRAAEGLLVLADGDRLRGTLVASDERAEIAWQSPAFAEPLRFPLTALQAVKFEAPASSTRGDYRFELPGGDELHGTLLAVDKSAVTVGTKWGTWRVKPSALVSLSHLHRALRRRGKSQAIDKVVDEKAHVLLATNKRVYAQLIGYDARSTAFSFQARDGVVTYQANDIAEIVLSEAGPSKEPVRLEYSEGTRLSGELVKVGDGKVVVRSSSLVEAVTLPLAGLRSIRAAAPGAPPPRRSGEALFVFGEDRLHGRLVAAEAKAGQTSLAWQPSGGSNGAAIRTGAAVFIDFGSTAATASDDLSDGEDRVFLKGGDVLRCRISTIDADETVLRVVGSELKRVANAQIKAVELGPHSRGSIADDKLERLLTVPRLQKDDPPTHVLGSLAGDYLRGQLIGVSEDRVSFRVGRARREFSRDRIASVVWLDASPNEAGEPAADQAAAGTVHVVDADGLSLSLASSRLDEGSIVGTNQLLGDCRLSLECLSGLRIGPASARPAFARRYVTWKLTGAIEPKAFAEDVAGGRQADESELVGRPAPDFTLELLDGPKFALATQRGKVVVLDFWASWCAPCIKGLPDLAALSAEFDAGRVRFVAVNLQETRDDAAQAAARLKLNLPVALDLDGRVASRYGAASIPYTVVVGPDGRVAHAFTGYGPRLANELREAIGRALAEGPQRDSR
jgi:thiol-disulfide isomerase/thioredoxin